MGFFPSHTDTSAIEISVCVSRWIVVNVSRQQRHTEKKERKTLLHTHRILDGAHIVRTENWQRIQLQYGERE